MAELTYEKEITGLIVIDPYNDFISEGGKVWDRLKDVAEANKCVPHMIQVLDVARTAGIRVFYALHHRYRPGDYETWKYIAPTQKTALVMCVMAADARFNYFIAARQFLWILPSAALLAAAAIERNERTSLALAALLAVFCLWQSVLFFLRPTQNWQAAADALLDEVHWGARLVVVPQEQAPLYDFFHPELGRAPAHSFRIVMAVTPYATTTELRMAIAAFLASRYTVDHENVIGGSRIICLHKSGGWR